MKKLYFLLLCSACFCLVTVTCGKKEEKTDNPPADNVVVSLPFYADTLIPANIEAYDITRSDSITVVLACDAEKELGETAGDYLSYRMVGIATAKFHVGQVPVHVEIAQFPSREDAYGFYARLRPNGIKISTLGMESYSLGNNLYFAAGEYAVTVSSEGDSEEQLSARSLLAEEINSRITQTTAPPFFMLFPSRYRVVPSSKYYLRGFLTGIGFDSVYTITYLVDDDTAVFFLMVDKSGGDFLRLTEHARSVAKVSEAPEAFPFYGDYSLMYDDPVHGRIVAGLVRSKLVGIIGYNRGSYQRLGSLWVKGLL